MKRWILIFLLLGGNIYGEELDLDTLLNRLSQTSYQNKLYEIQKNTNTNKEKYYKLDDFNGIETSVNSEYSDKEDSFQTTGRVQYGPIYIEGTKDYTYDDYASYGVEKNIKDLIYSSNKNELKKLQFTKEIDKLEYEKNLQIQKVNLINLYKEYRGNELEIQIKQSGIDRLKVEEEKMKKAYSLGAVSKIELASIQYSIKNFQFEIETLKKNSEKLKRRFFYDYGIEIGNSTLKEIIPPVKNIDNFIAKYGKKELDILKIQKEATKENVKYLKYNSLMPELSLGVEHNTKYDENRVIAKFSKRFFDLDIDLENEKDSLKEQEITLNQRILENEAEKLQITNNYRDYLKEYEINKNNAELELAKYDIKKLEYTLGKVDYLEVMEYFNSYLNYEVAKEKAKNNLNGYIYEIMIRGE